VRAQLLAFADRGPYAAGLITIEVADSDNPGRILPTDIWYPAEPSLRGRDLDPSAWPEHPLAQPHHAIAGAQAAEGRFPLLAFSHGNSGMRRQSTFLTTHLASWGFVVAAPDHVGNTFAEMQGLDDASRKSLHLEARRNRPRDLRAVIDAVTTGGDGLPAVDASHIGTFGHSFGGWTAFKLPYIDPRVAAVCGLAPAAEPFVGRKAFEPDELPFKRDVATLLIAGIDDVLVDVDKSVRSIFDRLQAPRAFVGINGADHFHFCDGIELLHMVHAMTPREGLTRSLLPYAELLDEARVHRLLRAVVTHFFAHALDGNPAAAATPESDILRQLDPALGVLS
jgi:predicted dienelactone hydrolase